LMPAADRIVKKAEPLAATDSVQSLKSVTHLTPGVNSSSQQQQDQEDQDDDEDKDHNCGPQDDKELECNSDSDDEEEQTCSDEAELDDATGGRDQHNNNRASIKQVQERQQAAEAVDAMVAANVSDMKSTASSVRRSTRPTKQPEVLTHSHGQLAKRINNVESVTLGKQKAKNNSATTKVPRPTTTRRSVTFADEVREHAINCVHDIATQAWDKDTRRECTPECGLSMACCMQESNDRDVCQFSYRTAA